MQPLLMFQDKELDPQHILITRDIKYRPEDKPNLELLLPWNYKDLIQDLNLESLFTAMSKGDNFIYETVKASLLSLLEDENSILYRQDILKDCIRNESIIREIYKLASEAIEKDRSIYSWGLLRETPSGILYQARNKIKMFFEILLKLKKTLENNESNFYSAGFKRFINMIKAELNDEYLREVNNCLQELEFNYGLLFSANLGYANKLTGITLHETEREKKSWVKKLFNRNEGYTYILHPRDESGAQALSDLRNQCLYNVADTLDQSMEHILNFFKTLRTELAFYIGCLNLYSKLKELSIPVCFPTPYSSDNKQLTFSELYDITLVLNYTNKVISNNLTANGKRLFIITGANNGGKTTFLRSIGLAQIMMQCGIFVTASEFLSEIRSSIFTHFKRKEDKKLESGKLDEELNRINQIVEKIDSKSMLLLNESFAVTNQKEGAEIAKQIIEALIECGIKVFYVTHNFEFANNFFNKNMDSAIFLRAERLENGIRTFKIKEGKPLQTSYGEDLFYKIFFNTDKITYEK